MMVFPYVHRSFRLTKMAEHGQRALCAVLRNIHAKLEGEGWGDENGNKIYCTRK